MHKLIPLSRVRELTGLGKTSIYDHAAAGTFPKPCKPLGRCARWLESEVQAWITEQIAERDAQARIASAKAANRAARQGACA